MELGNKIRQLRYRTSLTQEQLAERLGISAQAVSKWENAVAMPDISLLPEIAEVFGVSIDELFDLTADQKLRRIENRLEEDEELPPDVFREYEEFLREQLQNGDKKRVTAMLAELYHHRLSSCAKAVSRYAREAIRLAPAEKGCQWLLSAAEGADVWDWNVGNHSRTIEFYRELVERGRREPHFAPYLYLIDNLLADRRAEEAAGYLKELAGVLPEEKRFMLPVYEAHIALARFDEKSADAIIEKGLEDEKDSSGMMFEAAQYYARKCEYDKALRWYEASFEAEKNERSPRFTDALDGIAIIHEIRGEYRLAAEARRRIVELLRTEWGFTDEDVVREAEAEVDRLMRK